MKRLALVADDFDDIRSGVRRMLENLGFDVIEAADGREALQLFEESMHSERSIDLAVIDHLMPYHKGDVVIMGIKEKAKMHNRNPPVMAMLTGSKDGDLVARAQAAGLAQMFIKPEGLTALRDWIAGKPAVAA